MRGAAAIASFLRPFRAIPQPPALVEGYTVVDGRRPCPDQLNRLLILCGERPRPAEIWQRVLERSLWHLQVLDAGGQLVGFLRVTSDQALNANLWDLLSDPGDPERPRVLAVLVHTALARLRQELAGCSISLSAPPEAIRALEAEGFVVDPGGIRAMGRRLG